MLTEIVRPTYIAPGEKILFHPDLIQDVLDKKPRVPRHFEFDLTYRCNLACDGCHFAYTHQSPGDTSADMTPKLFDKISSDMAANDVRAMTFTGGGEPLFNPYHLDFFKQANERGIKMAIYTNGVLLEDETAEFIAQNFEWCYVSLDATTPEEYQAYKKRGQAAFNRNVANIKNFTQIPNRQATIGVGYLVNKDNYQDLDKAVPWLLDLGTNMVQLRPTVDTGNYQQQRTSKTMGGMAFQASQESWQEHYAWILEAQHELDKYEGIPRLETSRKKFKDLYRGERNYATCLATSISSAIGPHGEVWKCLNLRQIDKIGDLNTETLAEIYERKPIEVHDLTRCRIMCRNDQLNQALTIIAANGGRDLPSPNPNIQHIDFI